jgi:hypothetical protein
MAIPSYVGAGAGTSGVGTITPPLPANLQVNDILLMVQETANQASGVSNQAGGVWATVPNSPFGTGTAASATAVRLRVFWSRYNGTQTAPTLEDAGDHVAAFIAAFRGCKTEGAPWNVTSGDVEATSDTSVSVPGAVTTVPDCRVVIMCALMDDAQGFGTNWVNADLTAIVSNQVNYGHAAGNDGRIGLSHGEKAAAGTYGATTNTLTASSVKAFMTIALEGASSTFSGSGSPAVPAPGIAAVGLLAFLGSAALGVTAPSLSATGALIENRTATAGLTVPKPSLAASGALRFTGSGALLVTVPVVAGTGNTVFNVSATAALTVTKPALSGVGTITQASVTGSGAVSVPAPTVAGAGLSTFVATGAASVTAPSLSATGTLAFVATADLGAPTSIAGAGLETFVGTSALVVPIPVLVGGEDVTQGGAIARDLRTVKLVKSHTGIVTIHRRHGSSIMDTYTCDNDAGTCDDDHHTADDAPMRYI